VRGPTRLGMVLHGGAAATIDLGNAPPLTIAEESGGQTAPIRRAVSLRWLSGTVLTGFTSIFLMGGALMAALDNPNQFATSPEVAGGSAGDDNSSDAVFGRKGDRIKPLEAEVASRQVLQVSTVTRQGERDFIKLKPFVRINATLVTHKLDLAAEIPAYDPLHIFADSSSPDAPNTPATAVAGHDDQIYGANVDGEVSVKMSPFPADGADFNTAEAATDDDVEQIVRAAAHYAPDQSTNVASLPYIDPTRLDDSNPEQDPFQALGVRIIPENVSNVAKSDSGTGPGAPPDEKILAIAKGESFRTLLDENEVGGDDVDAIANALANLIDLNHLHVGQKVRVAYGPAGADGAPARPIRVSIYDDGIHQATIARADDNTFVRANEPSLTPDTFADSQAPAEDTSGMPRLYDAIYETALEQQVPPPLIDQLVRIFAFDVDYQARVTPGDSIEVFHSLPDPQDTESGGEPEVLYASLTLDGITKRFYRFRTPDDGVVDYYDEDGRSAKKFLIRKPVPVGHITSPFGWRVHPLLGYRRLHTGVDYGAPRGTPILAAGDGIVEKAGWTSGYGQFTLIKHTNGYETGYGHQSQIAKGIAPGTRVHQGQIIGYVGSTGLSTGPHLHFEIRINHQPVDPLRVRLPRGRVLAADLLASFDHERDRIDNLLGNPVPSTKVASTN
jgi:murein DD-endopeptidase MepM/ murein hydrolase activator NlpD